MSDAWAVRVGNAKIAVSVLGCIDCGTLWSSSWHIAKHVFVKIGTRQTTVPVYRCADCTKKEMKP